MSLYWLKSRWRTRAEYTARARRWLGGFGKANALVIVAILLAIFYYNFVLDSPAFPRTPDQRVQRLADRMAAAVEQGHPSSVSSFDDLIAAEVLTTDDAIFLLNEGVLLEPFDWGSPDSAVMLRRSHAGMEFVYRKGGRTDHYTIQTSPDGQYAVLVGPEPHKAARGVMQSVSVRSVHSDASSGSLVTSLLVPGYAAAHWSPDSRYLAVVARPEEDDSIWSVTTFVLAIGPDEARRLELPTSVDPAGLLAAKDPAARIENADVRFQRWQGSTLHVTSTGHGWVGPPAEAGSRQAGIQCRFDLAVSERSVRELGRDC
ncbi:MAG: hypothetical protein ABFS14_08715 [Gemmatimonadota bacterium]